MLSQWDAVVQLNSLQPAITCPSSVDYWATMAEAGDDPYRSALEVIEYAKLVPNDVFQLSLFVHEGLDPVETGRYVLDRISGESATKSVEDTLLSIKDDLISLASRGIIIIRLRSPVDLR